MKTPPPPPPRTPPAPRRMAPIPPVAPVAPVSPPVAPVVPVAPVKSSKETTAAPPSSGATRSTETTPPRTPIRFSISVQDDDVTSPRKEARFSLATDDADEQAELAAIMAAASPSQPPITASTFTICIWVPHYDLEKTFTLPSDASVWSLKQIIVSAIRTNQQTLAEKQHAEEEAQNKNKTSKRKNSKSSPSFCIPLPSEFFNYGLYLPPCAGRAGKFLQEERELGDYSLDAEEKLTFKPKHRLFTFTHNRGLEKLQSKAVQHQFRALIAKCIKAKKPKKLLAKIKDFLALGMDPNFLDDDGVSPLCMAVIAEDKELIPLLVSHGARIDYRNGDGQSVMHVAALKAKKHSISILLDLGAHPDYKDADGFTPVYCLARQGGNARALELLLKDRAQLNLQNEEGWTELHQACRHDQKEFLELLLMCGSNINAVNDIGNTGLHIAALDDNDTICKVLLDWGAARDVPNQFRRSPLEEAVVAKADNCFKLLRDYKPEHIIAARVFDSFYVQRTRRSSVHGRSTSPRGGYRPETLRRAKSVPTMNPDSTPQQTPSLSRASSPAPLFRRSLEIPRGPDGFDFAIKGSTHGSETQLSAGQKVVQVDEGGLADKAGLCVGDRLLVINGVDVTFLSHQRVLNEIKRSRGALLVEVGTRHKHQENLTGKSAAKRLAALFLEPESPSSVFSPVLDDEVGNHELESTKNNEDGNNSDEEDEDEDDEEEDDDDLFDLFTPRRKSVSTDMRGLMFGRQRSKSMPDLASHSVQSTSPTPRHADLTLPAHRLTPAQRIHRLEHHSTDDTDC
eukprot:m.159120 g.159120  ORF g.159120 m.159120 type:complete len:795 (+) comp24782_c0_seq2:94-2478(+)